MQAAAGLGLAACMISTAIAQDLQEVTFVQPSPSAITFFPIYVAIGEGYFADEGLSVRTEAVNGAGAVLQALAAGQAQFGRTGAGPLLQARSRGVDVVFLFNSLPRSSFGFLVKQDSEFQSPEELSGSTIGVGTVDGSEVGFARGILSSYGLIENEHYEFIAVGDGGTATAGFQRGDIDAYVGAVADAAILNHRGMAVRDITPDAFSIFFGNGYVAMNEFITSNPQAAEGFGRALVRATQFTADPANRDTVLAHLGAANPQELEDPVFATSLLDAILSKSEQHDGSEGIGYQHPEHWIAWHDSLVETGDLAEPAANLEAAYTNRFVQAWNTPR